MSKYDEILKLEQALKNDQYGELIQDDTHKGTMDDPIPMPYIRYSDAVNKLIEAVYAFHKAHPEYGLDRYTEVLEENGFSGTQLDSVDVSAMDGKCLMALFLCLVRGERFCDGLILDNLKNGAVLRWIGRLKQMNADMTAGMRQISIKKTDITGLDSDAIVNAANSALRAGGGVCGAIFSAAGERELQAACNRIGHCDTGSAVITPGFHLKAKYVIHAVGPQWRGGDHDEPKCLYNAYYRALELAAENGCKSVGFPLISAGIYGYPLSEAWRVAMSACGDFLAAHKGAGLSVVFAVLSDEIFELGQEILSESLCNAD